MLLSFQFRNFRSFRDQAILNMEATALKEYSEIIIPYGKRGILPSMAIYGKNGGGKSNLIRAFWLGVQFITNAERTQHEKAGIPVTPFELNDYSRNDATAFEFVYVLDGIRYVYGFEADRASILREYLYHSPKGQKAVIFERDKQTFKFPADSEKRRKETIKESVRHNQLFLAIACMMNYEPCIIARSWFRDQVFFSRNYPDVGKTLTEHSENIDMLFAMEEAARSADLGIESINFEINNRDIKDLNDIPDDMPGDIKIAVTAALVKMQEALDAAPNDAEARLRVSQIKATVYHKGLSDTRESRLYPLMLPEESDGTRRLMALAPALENALACGGLVLVDEMERDLHPLLVQKIINRFQDRESNPHGAQIIFTTHNSELLSMEYLRRDQVCFVDKDRQSGATELYSLADFSPRTDENIHKAYLVGKFGAVPRLEV